MKALPSFNRLIVLAVVLIAATAGHAQCVAAFNDSTSNGQVSFYNVSTGTTSATWEWLFPGGTPSSATTTNINTIPVVSYPSAGTYQVCLTMIDTANNCLDTICDSIIASASNLNVNISTMNANCGQCDGFASANASGGTGPYDYLWSNGATTTSISMLCAGTYSVTVTDTFGFMSAATANVQNVGFVTTSITSSNNQPCYNDSVLLTANSSGGTAPYTYQWSDGSNSSSLVFVATSASSTFSVTVTDSSGCGDSTTIFIGTSPEIFSSTTATEVSATGVCDGSATVNASGGNGSLSFFWNTGANTDSISSLCAGTYTVTIADSICQVIDFATVVTPTQSCTNSINGTLSPASESMVYLIQESSGVLTLIDTVTLAPFDSGQYSFTGLCSGTYYVKAALAPSSPQFSFFLPTYHVQSALWGLATGVVTSGSVAGVDINLLTGANLSGPGFIGGLISQGANRAEGDPVVNADVFLMDGNDVVLATTQSDGNGAYSFENLPNGDYRIMIDLLNFDPYPHLASISDGNVSHTSKNFVVEGGIIRPSEPLGIKSTAQAEAVKVFPNPVSTQLTIAGEALTSIQLIDLMGQQVIHVTLNNEPRYELTLEALASGQYVLIIESAVGISHLPLIKK